MEHLRAGPVVRLSRALVVAAVAGGIGAVAHLAAGGLLPGVPWLLTAGAALVWLGWAALGGPASTLRLVVIVGSGQFLTHLLLTATAGHAGEDHGEPAAGSVLGAGVADPVDRLAAVAQQSTPTEPRSGSLYDLTMAGAESARAAADAHGLAAPHWLLHLVHDLSGPHLAMALAHLVAAAGVAWWLAVGESALWTLVCLLGVAVLAATVAALAVIPLPAPGMASPPVVRRHTRRLVPPLPPPLLGSLARRGPPVALA